MTKQIPLTRGKFALVDNQDYEYLSQRKWYASQSGRRNWRAIRIENRKKLAMHRVIMNAPDGMDVDHINGDGLDNRRSNLRVCTHAENMFNQPCRIDSSTGVKGVFRAPAKRTVKYRAQIQVKKKQIYLGTFETIEEAAKAYDTAAEKYHGPFAKTNNLEHRHG